MKKNIYISILAIFGFASCSDSFLEEKMVGTITLDYFETEAGLESLIASTYNTIRWKYAWNEGPFNYEMGTDIGLQNDAWSMFAPSVWSPTGAAGTNANNIIGYDSRTTLAAYPTINSCNLAIESITSGRAQGIFATNREYANLRLSEAYFNRAWSYYMLVTLLGDVHMSLESNDKLPDNFNYVKSTSEEIYRQIIGDVRYCYEHLPTPENTVRGRLTKWAASHFLAKLYLQRAQGAEFKQYRAADGTIDHDNTNTHLGMLYKGDVSTDLDSAIYFASQVINSGYHVIEPDYRKLFSCGIGDYSNESNREFILQACFGTINNNNWNTRYNMRFHGYFTTDYVNTSWGIPAQTWIYGSRNTGFKPTDWGYDVFTNKIADSRFEKSFRVEYEAALANSSSKEDNQPYLAYNNSGNGSQTWEAADAEYFNQNILPTYNRPSWNNREAVAGDHKIGSTDLGLVFLENSKETAITLREAKAQPYVLYPRWIYDEDNNKYYYRRVGLDRFVATNLGLGEAYNQWLQSTKHIDPNRDGLNSESGTRDVAVFRLSETYLIRAEAYGRKGDFGSAISDINVVRQRAAYKPGETRAEVIARLYPGSETLSSEERAYPYAVASNKASDMTIDATYWNGSSEASKLENYPEEATSDLKRFIHFIYNEYSREFNSELVVYPGIHHAGIQAERIQWHHQMGSTRTGHWPVADNVSGEKGQNGNGKGGFKPAYTFKPFPQTFIDMLTDENGVILDAAAKRKYQNPGY